MVLYDVTGDAAVVRVDRRMNPLIWHIVCQCGDDTVAATVYYQTKDGKVTNLANMLRINYSFDKKKLVRELLHGGDVSPFVLPSLLGSAANERDRISRNINAELKNAFGSSANMSNEYAMAIKRFHSLEHELRKAAMCEALICFMRKFKGREDYKKWLFKNFGSTS